jgi:uncharacterized protein YbjQ (UPF0145 family)
MSLILTRGLIMRASPFNWLLTVLFLFMTSSAFAQSAAEAPPVRVFDAGELTSDRYTVVERIWTGTLRTLYWVPTHDDAGAAVTALTDKARRLGADGVVNLHCLNDGGWTGGYFCYGLAIKLK